jgi:hypothetical protein
VQREPVHAESVLASLIGMVTGGAAGLALATTGLGAPVVAVGLVLGVAVGSSIDAWRATRRRAAGSVRPDRRAGASPIIAG